MLQQKVQLYLQQIQQKMNQNSSSHTLIHLFYNLIKLIDNSSASSRRFNSSSQMDCKCYFETKSMFQSFLQKFKKQNQRTTAQDKVMAYMLKANSQMISGLNYRVKTTMYDKSVAESNLSRGSNSTRYKSLQFDNDFLFSDASIKNLKVQLQCESQLLQPFQSQNKLKSCLNRDKKIRDSQKQKNKHIQLALIDQFNSEKIIDLQSLVKGESGNQISTLWQNVIRFYDQHRLDQAFEQVQKYKQAKNAKSQLSAIQQSSQITIQEIEKQYQQMEKYHKYFDISSYTFDKKEDGMTMHYKNLDKQNLVAVHIQGEFDITIEKFLCISNQIQLYPKYVPFNYETKLLKNLSRNRKLGVSRVYLPFISNRQAYFHAAAYDRLKSHNSIFIYSKSITINEALQNYQCEIPKSDMVSLDYKFFMLEYNPISISRGKIKMTSCVDLKLNFMPKFILDKTARIFAFDYFRNMIKVSNKFKGSEWEKALIQNPQLYGFFKQKIDNFFRK